MKQTEIIKNNLALNLKKLTETPAVSGYEWKLGIADKIQEMMGSNGMRIEDNLVYKLGSGNKKIMLISHMDEVGFFISKKEQDFCRIVPIGDISAQALAGEKLAILKQGKIVTSKGNQTAKNFSTLKVTGLPDSVQVGDVGTFEKKWKLQNDIAFAPSLDNKVGCLTLIETYKEIKKLIGSECTVYFCFASREEVGFSGILSAVKAIDPDVCIDVDSAYAQPLEKSNNWCVPKLGKGIALQLMGTDFVLRSENRTIVEMVCAKENIPMQYEIPEGNNGGTNLSVVMQAGYDSIQINIPVADQHTAQSKTSITDIAYAIQVLSKLVFEL